MVRKGEITRSRLRREWSHHVALPAEKVRGLANAELVWGFAGTLSASPMTYSLRGDDGDRVMFCFGKPEDARTFAERFGGERIPRHRHPGLRDVVGWQLHAVHDRVAVDDAQGGLHVVSRMSAVGPERRFAAVPQSFRSRR
jgi:hypothetical protein